MKQLIFTLLLLTFCHFGNLQISHTNNTTNVEDRDFLSILKNCKVKLRELICAWSPIHGFKQFFNHCFMKVHNFFNPNDQYVIVESERCKNFTPTRYESKGDANEGRIETHRRPPYGSAFSSSSSSS